MRTTDPRETIILAPDYMHILTKKSPDVAHIKYLGFAREVFW